MNQASHTFAGMSVISHTPISVDVCSKITLRATFGSTFFNFINTCKNFVASQRAASQFVLRLRAVLFLAVVFAAFLYCASSASAQTTNGFVTAWGSSSSDQCNTPASAYSGVSAIAGGYFHTIALKTGVVLAWGNNDYGQCNTPASANNGVSAIAGGGYHTIALKDGAVLAWGAGTLYTVNWPIYGQCIIPTAATNGVTAIAGGGFHSIALKNSGVLAWGVGKTSKPNGGSSGLDYGQCIIPTAATSGVTAIAGGERHTIALKGGAVLVWGDNSLGQCNIPESAKSGVSAIAGGPAHTIALKDGAVLAWGWNGKGQCNVPTSANSGVSTIAGGGWHTIALKGGAVLAWGDNTYGQCNIPPYANNGVSAIAGGGWHTIALSPLVDTDGDGVFDAQDNCVNIANPSQADCDNDGIGDTCEIAAGALDADLNGIPDGCEGDCNVNGQLDYLDIAAGAADCNGNLMIDSCEDGSGIYRNSGNLGNIGSGVPRSVTFDTLPAAVNSVTLEVSARANLSATNRFLIMKLNGGTSTYLFQNTGTDCPSTANTYSRTFTASEFNTLTASGSLAVTFTAPGTVNAASCGSDALLQVRLAYEQAFKDCDNDGLRDFCAIASGAVKDCNRNGIPDSCDIATGFAKDCNGNNIPDSCDIATGLAPDCNRNGIPDSCDTDTDGDGIIDACDPCPNVAGPCNGCPLNVCGDCGTAADADGDGTANCIDVDDDNDGVVDSMDAFPLDASESVDTDGDGQGNNADQDDDGDGTDDATDGCPLDATKSEPGQCGCGNPDTDTDGDGVADCVDNCPAVANPSQTDCDGNGIGEACETFTDCNANGIPDSCDLASGFAQDCNGNGKPDSCDLAVSGSPYPGAVQWTVASGGNGHWYAILPENQFWEVAKIRAEQLGGYLATTTSNEELLVVRTLLPYMRPDGYNSDVFIGANRINNSSPWQWVTGEPFLFTAWLQGQPDNGPESLCLEIVGQPEWPIDFGHWNDESYYAWGPGQYSVIEWNVGLPTESDCNANTIPDSCELANGGDCNNNGLLDACETFDQTTPDCNNNGVPDSCDIESRFARDCDLNNVPDSCDIAAGALDENSDGRIDACNYAVGDFDLSNEVDPADLSFLLLFFGEENPPFGDLDGSGVCDSADLSYCLLNFGPLE